MLFGTAKKLAASALITLQISFVSAAHQKFEIVAVRHFAPSRWLAGQVHPLGLPPRHQFAGKIIKFDIFLVLSDEVAKNVRIITQRGARRRPARLAGRGSVSPR